MRQTWQFSAILLICASMLSTRQAQGQVLPPIHMPPIGSIPSPFGISIPPIPDMAQPAASANVFVQWLTQHDKDLLQMIQASLQRFPQAAKLFKDYESGESTDLVKQIDGRTKLLLEILTSEAINATQKTPRTASTKP